MASDTMLMGQVLDLFSKFSFEKLDETWVTNVIESDFTEVDAIPNVFEEIHSATNFSGLFSAQVNALRRWIDKLPLAEADASRKSASMLLDTTAFETSTVEEEGNSLSKFWLDFAQIVKVKNLMSFVFYHVHTGQRYDCKEDGRELGTLAASLYFLVLCVPGSNAFRMFHPVLYLKSLDMLRLTTRLHVGVSSPRKGKGGHGKNSQRRSAEDPPASQGADDDDDDADLTLLSPQEANRLIRILNVLLSDFIRLTQRFSLKHSPESLDETLSILVDVTRSETHNAHAVFLGRHSDNTVTSLVYNAYVALQCVCSTLHGAIRKIVTLVLKHIVNNILMVSRGASDLSVRSLSVIRDHSVIFVKYLLTQIKEQAYDGVYILVQHLCMRVPDKADFRQKTAQSVVEILRHLTIKLYTRLMKWFYKFSHNEKAGHRLFTLEIVSKMLCEEERHVDDQAEGGRPSGTSVNNTGIQDQTAANAGSETIDCSFNIMPADHSVQVPTNRNILSHKFLLSIIFSRCRDSAATVRSKALTLLAECTLSDNPTISLAMKQIFNKDQPVVFTTPHIDNNLVNIESPLDQLQEEDDDGLEMPNANMVMSLLRRRAVDNKVTVRKSALQVMCNLMKLNKEMVTKGNLKVFCDHCRDPAMLIRKQMVTALTTLVETYPQPVAEAWVTGVLPAILDPETKVQEKVVEMLHQVVLGRLVPAGRRDAEETNELAWLLLATVTKLSFHKFLNKSIHGWGNSGNSKSQIVEIAKSHIGGDHNEQAWLLLSLLSHCVSMTNTMFAVRYYTEHCDSVETVGWYTLQQVVRVLCNSVSSIPVEACRELHSTLLVPMTDASVGAGLMPPIMDLLALINTRLHGEEEQGHAAMQEWVAPLLQACDDYLQTVLFGGKEGGGPGACSEVEEKLFRRIFLLGEAGLLHPNGVNKRMFLMLQSIIFQGQAGTSGTVSPPLPVPSSQTQTTQPRRVNFAPSKRVQAVSVAVLGKLCLQHESQAKRLIPALGRMLDTDPGPDIKTNIIFTLADMCVRYATVVDPLMPQVTSCLRDPDLQVRRTTLTLLISLLQEDYLKLKGSFFYRILQCLTDEHEEIRNTLVFFLTERLLKRFPKIFSQHFIECIFHYNCYEEHESYNRFSQNQQEKELFSLAGPDHFEERMTIYKFMLDHMQDDQRFSITQRLCHDVLGGVVDGRMGATGCDAVLRDTLLVLSSDEIKLASLKARPEEDQATNEEEQAQIAGMAIKKTIISQVVKRNVIENIVPILIALKHKLEEQRSPLMKQLLLYFKEIMVDYKTEIKEILAGDKQLAEEIEFDLRKFEERQREEDEQQRKAELARQKLEKRKQKEKDVAEEDDVANVSLPGVHEDMGQSPSLASEIAASQKDSTDLRESINPERASDAVNQCTTPVPDMQDDETENEAAANTCSVTESTGEKYPRPLFASRNILSPSRPNTAKTSLLRAAVMNHQRLTERRRSISVTQELIPDHLAADNSKIAAALQKRRASIAAEYSPHKQSKAPATTPVLAIVTEEHDADNEEREVSRTETPDQPYNEEEEEEEEEEATPTVSANSRQQNTESETVSDATEGSADSRALGTDESRRKELLRAISTPTRNQSIVNNITFINQTQEVSCIGMDSTNSTMIENHSGAKQGQSRDVTQETILLHLRSPEAFAKDEEFSRLRRNTKKNLLNKYPKEKPNQSKEKKLSSGGFLESYDDEQSVAQSSCGVSLVDNESSDVLQQTQDTCSSEDASSARSQSPEHSKRNREAAAFSPQVRDKYNKRSNVKPSTKKSRTKKRK